MSELSLKEQLVGIYNQVNALQSDLESYAKDPKEWQDWSAGWRGIMDPLIARLEETTEPDPEPTIEEDVGTLVEDLKSYSASPVFQQWADDFGSVMLGIIGASKTDK